MLALLLRVDQMGYKSKEAAIWCSIKNDYVEVCCCCMVLLVLDILGTMHFCKLLLVQRSFHANNLTENENVTASPALDCYAIVGIRK